MPDPPFEPVCSIPQFVDADCITLAYGEGGWLTRRFLRERILSRFDNAVLRAMHDAAVLDPTSPRIAVTTDSYTVSPLFFPGGDIGQLAVYGTVNDLAVAGARPRWITLAMIIEEGTAWAAIDAILDSVQAAALVTGVAIVAGDTKVVPRGAVDGVFLNTTGIGEVGASGPMGMGALSAGDAILVTGPIGQHGAAILCARESFEFDPPPVSDCAPLAGPLQRLWDSRLPVRCARDATRGGVAAVLHEWSQASGLGITVEEAALPVRPGVRAVCELLGLDPIHLACEGTCVLAVDRTAADAVLQLLRCEGDMPLASAVGEVTPSRSTPVRIVRSMGRAVPLDEPAGSPLPRIC